MQFTTTLKTSIFATSVALVFSATSAFAAGSYGAPCTTSYGGGYGASPCPQIKFTVDKMVQKPNSSDYVDNMSVSDAKYGPSSIINFRVKVRNEGKDTINTLNVVDTLPQYLSYYNTSAVGSYDVNSRQVSYTISSLKSGEEKSIMISTKANEVNNLPSQDTVCVINQVQVTADNGAMVGDNSQVCIAKGVTPTTPIVYPAPKITQTPATGPEALALFALGPIGGLGVFLRRKTSK